MAVDLDVKDSEALSKATDCLVSAAQQADQALMGRYIEMSHAWMEIHRLRSAAAS